MKIPRATIVLFPTLVLAGGLGWFARGASAGAAHPARLVTASIAVDGRVVLEASTSDDGHPDADAVWGYLLGSLEFRPTEAFAALRVDPAAEKTTIGWRKSRETEDRGEPPAIALEVSHGGDDAPFELLLTRDPGKETWRVDRKSVEDRFPHRRITRAEAAGLVDPERRK